MLPNLARLLRCWRPLYWLRTHTIHRYHLVDCRNRWYRWGWCDRSELLLYASFAILTDFMEKEFPGFVEWDPGLEAELHALHNWWKTGRQAERDAADALYERAGIEMRFVDKPGLCTVEFDVAHPDLERAWTEADFALSRRDDEMLCRLLQIRHELYT